MRSSPQNHRTDPLGLHSFSAVDPQTWAWSEDESSHSFTHRFTAEVITVFLPPLWEVPDLWNSSGRFPGADQTPLPCSGLGPDHGLTFQRESAYWVQRKLPGELVHFSLESSRVKTTQRVGTPGLRRTQNTIQSQVLPYSGAVQLLASG
jgi:hypothetical protein